MARLKKPKPATPVSMERRHFLRTGGLAGAAGLVAPSGFVGAQQPAVPPPSRPVAPPVMTMAAEGTAPADVEALTTDSSGSDFMVDVMNAVHGEGDVGSGCGGRVRVPAGAAARPSARQSSAPSAVIGHMDVNAQIHQRLP